MPPVPMLRRMRPLAFAVLGLLFLVACSPTAGSGANDGGEAGSGGGAMSLKGGSFTGTAQSGVITLSITSEASARVARLAEIRLAVPTGDLTFPVGCDACTESDSFCVDGGKTALLRIEVANLDATGRAAVGVTCGGQPLTLRATSDSPAAATSDKPSTVTLRGTHIGGSPWAASANLL